MSEGQHEGAGGKGFGGGEPGYFRCGHVKGVPDGVGRGHEEAAKELGSGDCEGESEDEEEFMGEGGEDAGACGGVGLVWRREYWRGDW